MADVTGMLTTFLAQMVALSVAAERVTETIKQFTQNPAPAATPQAAATRSWIVQLIAIASGVFVVALSGLNPANINPSKFVAGFDLKDDWTSWLITGILVSGGSAFWNNLLDILKAAKVQKEATANTTPGAAAIAP